MEYTKLVSSNTNNYYTPKEERYENIYRTAIFNHLKDVVRGVINVRWTFTEDVIDISIQQEGLTFRTEIYKAHEKASQVPSAEVASLVVAEYKQFIREQTNRKFFKFVSKNSSTFC